MTRWTIRLAVIAQVAVAASCAAKDDGRDEGAKPGNIGASFQPLDASKIELAKAAIKNAGLPKADAEKAAKATEAMKPGLIITSLKKDGPAHKAGMKFGDIIRSVNGKSAEKLGGMQKAINKLAAGDEAEITYLRIEDDGNSAEKTVTVTVMSMEEVAKLSDVPPPEQPGEKKKKKGAGKTDRVDENFDKLTPGGLPDGWKARTMGKGETAEWQVQAAGGKAKNVLQIMSPANGPETLNLCIDENAKVQGNTILKLRLKPAGGENCQSGGIVWGYQNKNNFYMVLLDFKKGEIGTYKVSEGKMERLDAQPYKLKSDDWTDVSAEHTQGRVLVRLNGVTAPVLKEARDRTFRDGKAGVVTVGDSNMMFDEVKAAPPPRMGGS